MEGWAKQIEEDLNWREAELASFKILISSAPKGSVRESALLRAIWALLYAHYEGFCKFAWIDEHAMRIKTLVARRNEIAHGQKMTIKDIDEYQKYEDSVLLIMHELAVSVIDALEGKKHLK